jgi:hypothetical protein
VAKDGVFAAKVFAGTGPGRLDRSVLKAVPVGNEGHGSIPGGQRAFPEEQPSISTRFDSELYRKRYS